MRGHRAALAAITVASCAAPARTLTTRIVSLDALKHVSDRWALSVDWTAQWVSRPFARLTVKMRA